MRINRKDLGVALGRLNDISKQKYRVEGAYGGWQLQLCVKGTSAIENITNGFKPARELYNIIHAILRYISLEDRE